MSRSRINDVSLAIHAAVIATAYVSVEASADARARFQQGRNTMNVKLFAASASAVLMLGSAMPAMAYTGQELATNAKVSIAEARATALKAHPGTITDEELEKESGASGLRYSFDIKPGNATQEVGVDAPTGKVLENAKEGPHPD
ncbi:MAG: PepSY domain-containing protein [Nitrobacter sp.]